MIRRGWGCGLLLGGFEVGVRGGGKGGLDRGVEFGVLGALWCTLVLDSVSCAICRRESNSAPLPWSLSVHVPLWHSTRGASLFAVAYLHLECRATGGEQDASWLACVYMSPGQLTTYLATMPRPA